MHARTYINSLLLHVLALLDLSVASLKVKSDNSQQSEIIADRTVAAYHVCGLDLSCKEDISMIVT